MDFVMTSSAFQTYALCSAILVLKMLYSATYTGVQRQRNQGYVNPEDAKTFGSQGASAGTSEAPAVAHALRIQRNDLENIPAFLVIGLLYVMVGGTAASYFWVFTIARIAHTVCYTLQLQPWRALSFGVGALCVVGMCVKIIMETI